MGVVEGEFADGRNGRERVCVGYPANRRYTAQQKISPPQIRRYVQGFHSLNASHAPQTPANIIHLANHTYHTGIIFFCSKKSPPCPALPRPKRTTRCLDTRADGTPYLDHLYAFSGCSSTPALALWTHGTDDFFLSNNDFFFFSFA